jgi:DNA-binding NarL/FixJ family response regulator
MAPEPSAPLVSVAVVEDDRGMREALAMLLGLTPGFECVGLFASVEHALSAKVARDPNAILLDVHLPGVSGPDGVPLLKARFPAAQIVMLTVYADEAKVFTAICNGACGYLLKDTPPVKLLEAIREAVSGGAPMSPGIARQVVNAFQKTAPPRVPRDENLTPQEVRLLQLLSDGYSYEGASAQLNISVNTVRNYIRSVYDKLHVHTRAEAVGKALRNGVIS